MDPKLLEALTFVYAYAADVDDWVVIKKELLRELPHELRSLFSSRDPVTKKQRPNELELKLAERWSVMSGRTVLFT